MARNDKRNNGKASKKRAGVNPNARTGRTVNGYSPQKLLQRAAKRPTTGGEPQ